MAKYNSIALGKARGSAGNVRFSIWKGIPVASQKPESVANPRTVKQQNARARLSALVAVFRRMPSLLDTMYAFRAVQKSAYNAFVSANNIVDNLPVTGSPPVASLDASDLIIANENIVTATCTASVSGDDIAFDLSGLTASTLYSILGGVGNVAGTYSENPVATNFTTDVSGAFTASVADIGTAVPSPTYAFCVVQNQVTGVKFAFSLVL
jgi:hypothetical protein